MRRTEVILEPEQNQRLIDYMCELVEFASDPKNISRLSDDKKYQDLEHYVGKHVKQELLRLNLIEAGQKGKLQI